MSKKLLASLAAVVGLAACECTEETRSGMHDWPNPSAGSEGPVAGSAEHFKRNTQDTVYFDFDKSTIRTDAATALAGQAAWAKENPSVNFMVEGHCDERGTTEYNLGLGERRANATKKALVANGVDKGRVDTVSYGKERLTGLGHDKDRRAVTVVR